MFRRVAVGTALALALLAAFGLGWFLRGESAPSAPPAPTAVLDRFEGALLPVERRFVFAPLEARVVRFEVEPGSTVGDRQRVVLVYCPELEKRILQFRAEVDRLTEQIKALELEAQAAGLAEVDRRRILAELHRARAEREVDVKLGDGFIDGFDADEKNPGYFWLKSPPFQAEFADKGLQWTVLDQDSRKDLIDRTVRPSEPLLRLGARNGPWEIELKIPQKHIGQVLTAFGPERPIEIEVEVSLPGEPGRAYKGKLRRDQIAGEARPAQDDEKGSDPVVLAYVRIDGPDIPEGERIPPELLDAGRTVEVRVPPRR